MDVPSCHIGRHSIQILVSKAETSIHADARPRTAQPGLRRNTGMPDEGDVVVDRLGGVVNTDKEVVFMYT